MTKWRLNSPALQAALNRRRCEDWGPGIDRLRSLIPKALDARAEELEHKDSRNRVKAQNAPIWKRAVITDSSTRMR
jgi:hypothetical protein